MIYQNQPNNSGKFTKGEKCIFFHLVLVFVATLILLVVFILHLYTVRHDKYNLMSARPLAKESKTYHNNHQPIGVVYLETMPEVIVCNSLLVNSKWSVSPANCVVVRSDPDMALWITSWRIKYQNFITSIKQSIAHSHFNKDTFTNNIGLFEHVEEIPLKQFFIESIGTRLIYKEPKSYQIISYTNNKGTAKDGYEQIEVSLLSQEKCMQYTLPIVDIRDYEFCVVPREQNKSLEYGALILGDKKIIGIYSWGERKMVNLPFVFLNLTNFSDWVNTITGLN